MAKKIKPVHVGLGIAALALLGYTVKKINEKPEPHPGFSLVPPRINELSLMDNELMIRSNFLAKQ